MALKPGRLLQRKAFGMRESFRRMSGEHDGRLEEKSARSSRACVRRCFDVGMTSDDEVPRIASASREIAAGAGRIFELIADPAQQPRWDGNDNLAEAVNGQRVRAVGEVFTMTLTGGSVRENHVVEFDEGRRIAWRPAEPGQAPPGRTCGCGNSSQSARHERASRTPTTGPS